MKPFKFEQANKNLLKPENMTDEECSSLWVYNDGTQCVSCWRLTWKERLKVLFFGRVWLTLTQSLFRIMEVLLGSVVVVSERKLLFLIHLQLTPKKFTSNTQKMFLRVLQVILLKSSPTSRNALRLCMRENEKSLMKLRGNDYGE